MGRKAASLVLTAMLFFSMLMVLFSSFVSAMTDEHNLSGLIWLSDGSTPPSQTGFAIWVYHTGIWYRFPDSGWFLTSDVVNGQVWYAYVLPDEWHGIKWDNGDTYRVEVDASVWGEITGNATSNGTASAGDPIPPPYDPTNPDSINYTINYLAGGGYGNEQQWDVRTLAPKDLIPTNVTANGMRPEDYPSGMPVGGGTTVEIHFNATNIEILGTGGRFDACAWNCTVTGLPLSPPMVVFPDLGPLNEYGNTSGNGYDTGELIFYWVAPLQPGDYYINITVDCNFNITEVNETNNTIIIHFIVGPDLIPIDVTVDGIEYPDWPQISPIILPAPGQWIHIKINMTNVGATESGGTLFSVVFYNVSVTGAHQQIGAPFHNTTEVFSNISVGEIFFGGEAYWYAPSPGEFRINLTVDFGNNVPELNDNNNTYVLRVLVGPDIIPTDVTVGGQPQFTSPSSPIPIGLGQMIVIGVNATNIGYSPTGGITWVGFYNSTISGTMLEPSYYKGAAPELNGSTELDNTFFIAGGFWISPDTAGIYYVTIYVDFDNDTFEFNETNNSFVICFLVGPDLTYTNVTLNGNPVDVTDPFEVWYVSSGAIITIGTNATNVGASPTGKEFCISFTNCTATGQETDFPFATFFGPLNLLAGQTTGAYTWSWLVPNSVGDSYINITIDYLFDVSESVETNNSYILHLRIAPDYAPGYVTIDNQYAFDESMIWNVAPGVPVDIGINCTNVGYSGVASSVTYSISFYNSSQTRTKGSEFENISSLPGLPISGDSGQQVGAWTPPNQPGEYYVLVVLDSANTTWEINEYNNTFLLHFAIGPDLIPTNVMVDGSPAVSEAQIWYFGPGEIIVIGANAANIGFSGTGNAFIISLYNVSIGGSQIIGDNNTHNISINPLNPGEDSGPKTWLWSVPLIAGEYYVNITVDLGNITWESNEYNNTFTIHFVVAPDLTYNNVSVDGLPITSYPMETVIVYPGQIINISVNATNVGLTSTGILQFNMTYWNSTMSGQTQEFLLYDSGLLGPLAPGVFTENHYVIWVAPSPDKPTDYYINITVDSTWMVSEWVETNNTYILHIRVDAPDLTPDKVDIEAASGSINVVYDEPYSLPTPFVSEEIYIPVGTNLFINFTIANIGGIDQLIGTNVTAYNISDIGGKPKDPPFYESSPTAILLPSGGSILIYIIWPAPGVTGVFYFNVSIDFNGTLDIGGRIIELNETNNTFTFFINITSKPITTLRASLPKYQPGIYWYVNSTTELNLTVIGPNPPLYTHYRITNMTSGMVGPWLNYTEQGVNFTMIWGEGAFRIEYNSTNAIGGAEPTRTRIIIVDDTPPMTDITVGTPNHTANIMDVFNVTSSTPFYLSAVDLPPGVSPAGPGIMNASGINGVLGSGIFYIIENVTIGNVTGWREYFAGSPIYLDDPTWDDGYYRIWFNSTDNLLQKEEPKYILIYFDNTGPQTTIAVGNPKYPHPIHEWFVSPSTPFTLSAYEVIGSGANQSTIRFRITNLDTGNFSSWIVRTSFDIENYYPDWNTDRDGNYTIEFRARDNLGNWGPISNIIIYVDDTPPTVNLIVGDPKYPPGPVNIWNITSNTNLTFLADDGQGCGVNYSLYRIYNNTFFSSWFNYTSTFNLSSFSLNEGLYTIEYTSYDFLGNHQPFYDIFYLDDTPPTTPIVVGTPKHSDPGFKPNVTDLTLFEFNGRTDGLGCGVAYTRYRVYCEDNVTYVTNWKPGISFSFSSFPYGLDDGNYTIEFFSVDRLGNTEPTNYYRIYLDNTYPETSILVGDPRYPPGPANVWNVTSATRFYLYSDDGSGCGVDKITYKIRHYLDPRDWNQIIPITYNNYFIIIGSEGNYTIRYSATDYLYNGEPVHEIVVTVDNTPPTSNISFGTPQYRVNETSHTLNITSQTPINITSVDGGVIPVGLDFIMYMIDDDFDLNNGNLTGWVTYLGEFNLSGLDDGDYVIYYYAADLLGNPETVNNVTIIVDNSPPQTEFRIQGTNVTGVENIWVKPDTEYILTSSDFGSPPVGLNYTEYSIDGSRFEFYDGHEVFDFVGSQNGSHTIRYRSIDLLGNVEGWKNVTIIMDDAGPLIDIISTPNVVLPDIFPSIPTKQINFSEITNLTIDATDTGVPVGIPPSGVNYTQYIIDPEDPDAVWRDITQGTYNIFNLVIDWYQNASRGYWHHNISFRAFDHLGWEGDTITIWFYIEGDITPPLPPELKVCVMGDDIYLKWIKSPSDDIHHYLIYRSDNKTGFDFNEPWVDTSNTSDKGVIPLRTTWNHTNAVNEGPEYYYTIRGVDGRKNTGYTSNIAGKVTLSFERGYNDFALPLEIFDDIRASEMLNDGVFIHDTDTIYRYDTQMQCWLGHPKFLPSYMDDFTLNFGEAYMIYIMEENAKYTFCGSTGTSIRYIGGVGEELDFRNSLKVEVNENLVQLNWESADNATGYAIYRATARIGNESITNYSFDPVIELSDDERSWIDSEAFGDEYYYMVVAKSATGEESSTYAIGIKTYEIKGGYSSISLVLEPKTEITPADFSNRMLSSDSDTLYYYDRQSNNWYGHPRFLPESINNGKVLTGRGYMVFVHTETIKFTLIGV